MYLRFINLSIGALLNEKVYKCLKSSNSNKEYTRLKESMKQFNLSKQEIESILIENKDRSLRVSDVLSQIDFTNFTKEEAYTKFTISSVLKLYTFRLIKGIGNYEKLKDYLTSHEDEAFQLGIYKDKDNRLEIAPKRTYNYYLQTKISPEQKEQLNLLAADIISLATKNKVLLDLEIVKKTIEKKKKDYSKEIKEAVKLVKKLVYPNVDLKIHHNAKFNKKDFLDVLVYVALNHDFTNNGALTFGKDNEDRPTPSGDLMMHHFSKFRSIEQVREMFENISDIIFSFAKKNYNVLKQRKLNIAYDIHKIPFYGKNMNYIRGGKHEKGTSDFFEFLTCSVVVTGRRFIVDVIPVHQLDSLDKLIDRSLERVKSKIRIEMAFLDRGFDRAKIINVLKKHNVKFIMPKIRSPTVKSWFDKSQYNKSRVVKDFQIGGGKDKALANLVLVNNKIGIKRAFICNFDIAPQLAYRLFSMYGKRWGIETSYRNLDHDFKPKTTTPNYCIRLFYFLFSCCLYNLWVLVNICVSLRLYGRIKDKPLITAKMFVLLLYKVQIEYFEGGG